jgi:hypothetical protein
MFKKLSNAPSRNSLAATVIILVKAAIKAKLNLHFVNETRRTTKIKIKIIVCTPYEIGNNLIENAEMPYITPILKIKFQIKGNLMIAKHNAVEAIVSGNP